MVALLSQTHGGHAGSAWGADLLRRAQTQRGPCDKGGPDIAFVRGVLELFRLQRKQMPVTAAQGVIGAGSNSCDALPGAA